MSWKSYYKEKIKVFQKLLNDDSRTISELAYEILKKQVDPDNLEEQEKDIDENIHREKSSSKDVQRIKTKKERNENVAIRKDAVPLQSKTVRRNSLIGVIKSYNYFLVKWVAIYFIASHVLSFLWLKIYSLF